MRLLYISSILFILAIKHFGLLHTTDLLVHGGHDLTRLIIAPNLLIHNNAIARDGLTLNLLTEICMLVIHFS